MRAAFREIIEKVLEYALRFFNYTMNVGENRFMLVNYDVFNGDVSEEESIFFIASFVLMSLIAIMASDSFKFFHPIEGIKEWKKKIHVVKVTVFAAAVFSLHTFYKTFVTGLANFANDSLGSITVNCLGSFINPISVLIVSIAIITVPMRKKYIQAFFLALSIFVTPALLTYAPLTKEYITIYVVGITVSLVAGALYKRFSMYVTYAIMSFVYLIGKFFLVANSRQILLTDGRTIEQQVGQYISCARIDIGMIIILMLILFIYRTVSETITKKKIIANIIVAAVFAVVFVFSYPARILFPVSPVVFAKEETNRYDQLLDIPEKALEAITDIKPVEEKRYFQEDVIVTNAVASSFLKGSTNTYDINYTIDGKEDTCWQDGVKGDGIGEKLSYVFDRAVICKVKIVNGNRRNGTSYAENGRLAKARLYFYDGDKLNFSRDIDFIDNETMTSEFWFGDIVESDKVIIEIVEVYNGSKYHDTCVAEVEFEKLTEQ